MTTPSLGLPREIEKPFRTALDHAAKQRVSELHDQLTQLTDEQIAGAIGMCGFVSAYIAIDVVSRRWPTDVGLHHMAEKVMEGGNRDEPHGVTEQNLYRFLSKCALAFKPYADVFDDLSEDPYKYLAAPFFFTINLLATFSPKGKTIWEFLDQIENAYEGAWLLDLNLLPALMVRARMPQSEQNPGGSVS